jgi:hypothetical protein
MGLTEAGAEHMRASQKKMVEKFQELYCPHGFPGGKGADPSFGEDQPGPFFRVILSEQYFFFYGHGQ